MWAADACSPSKEGPWAKACGNVGTDYPFTSFLNEVNG